MSCYKAQGTTAAIRFSVNCSLLL